MLEVSDFTDLKFNVCPGYPPKIVTLDQQEACPFHFKGVLRHFLLTALNLSLTSARAGVEMKITSAARHGSRELEGTIL